LDRQRTDHGTIDTPSSRPAFLPVEIRPNVGAALAARLADKQRLDIRQLNVIRPSIGVDRCRVAALVIRAIDQKTAHARGAHLSEGVCWRVTSGMAHDSADRASREAAKAWAFQHGAHKARYGCDALSQGGRLSDGIV